jgi:hypothetical protein
VVWMSNVLYGCKTWSLTLKEEQRLRVSGNRLLRIIRILVKEGRDDGKVEKAAYRRAL